MLRKALLEAGAIELQVKVRQEDAGMSVLVHPWRRGAFQVAAVSTV
jgi:hypothetical protein